MEEQMEFNLGDKKKAPKEKNTEDTRTEDEVRASMVQKRRESLRSGRVLKLDDRETALFLAEQKERREEQNREYGR